MTLSKRLLLAFSLCGGLAFFAHPAAAALPARFRESTSLLPNGAILIAGGQTTTAASSALNEAELLMPDGTVTVTGNTLVAVGRSSHTATVLPNGLVLIAGGINNTGAVNLTTDIYNPTTNLFTAGPSLSVPRFAHTATLLQNGTVLICGGYTDALGTVTNTCDVYTPDMTGAFGIGSIAAGPAMGTPRAFHTASLLSNGNVLITGGLTTGGVYTQTTEIYSNVSGLFGGGPGMSINRAFHTATTLGNGQVLIAGGGNSNETSTINMGGNLVTITSIGTAATDIYDPQSNTIAPGTPMNEARRKFSATLDANGSLNVTGGFGSIAVASDTYPSILVSTVLAFTGGNTFSNQPLDITNSVPPKLALSVDAAGTIVGGQAYFPPSQITFSSGTVNVSSFTVALSNQGTCIYTPGGSPTPWQCGVVQVLSLPPVSGSITCTVPPCTSPITLTPPGQTPPAMKETAGNSTPVFVVISSMVFADEESYNPSQNSWTLNTAALSGSNPLNASSSVPPYSFARFAHPSFLSPMDSDEMIGGATWNGSSDVTQSSVLAGILSNTAPTSGPSLPGPRAYHTATTLPNGKIIIAGGQDTSTDILSSSLIFDPVALTFNPTAPLNVARSGHTATLLPSGNILAAGGTNFSTGTLSSAEIYNSTGSAWTITGSMNTPSQYHTATILSSGTVMVVGGINGNTVLNRAEIYYSTSATWALTGALATATGAAATAT